MVGQNFICKNSTGVERAYSEILIFHSCTKKMPDRTVSIESGVNYESIIQLGSGTRKVAKSNLVDFFCFWPNTVVQLRKHIHE